MFASCVVMYTVFIQSVGAIWPTTRAGMVFIFLNNNPSGVILFWIWHAAWVFTGCFCKYSHLLIGCCQTYMAMDSWRHIYHITSCLSVFFSMPLYLNLTNVLYFWLLKMSAFEELVLCKGLGGPKLFSWKNKICI